ncbi:MAG: 4-hydroxythreonine-4-phosphate dehydrogenase PdxA [Planctomycetia bacterium]|nr:4-hydroxythreonine-4-phosphate dehydrogenase PdxA [Planctomycetia bacterium]
MLPRIAITMGDPAGIGPEIGARILSNEEVLHSCIPILVGDASVLREFLLPGDSVDVFTRETFRPREIGRRCILDLEQITPAEFVPGKVQKGCGAAAYQYILTAIRLCEERAVAAMVTAPIHKEALHLAGVPFPGHTEILVHETGVQEHVMMLTSEEITSALVTAHVGYAEVPREITPERVFQTIRLTTEAMRQIRGRESIRLTVCGLNPHAGEHGLFGHEEEERLLQPAIRRSRAYFGSSLEITEPLPPDTAFLPAKRAQTDAYICMTHDQGLIPLKMLAFDSAVNITLGLPILRTSVDHGTAMDIARTGAADERSLISAIRLAKRLIIDNG